ncbi:Virginiamycin B lyase [compost metagenome]
MTSKRWLPLLSLLLALAAGCAPDDDTPLVTGVQPGTGTPSADTTIDAKIPTDGPSAPTSPTPAPTPSGLDSGIDTTAPTPGTDGGYEQVPTPRPPAPSATPLGTLLASLYPSDPLRGMSLAGNQTEPWVLRSADVAKLNGDGEVVLSAAPGADATALVATAYGLWVLSASENRLYRLSNDQYGLEKTGHGVSGSGVLLAGDDDEGWVAHAGGQLTRVRLSDGGSQGFAGVTGSPVAIALSSAHAWVATSDGKLHRIDRETGVEGATIDLGGTPTALAVDRLGNAWAATHTPNALRRVPSGSSVADPALALGSRPYALAAGDRVWVAQKDHQRVTHVALDGTGLTSLTLQLSPTSVGIDASGRVWLLDPSQGRLDVLWGR